MVFYPTEPAPSSSLDSATIRGNFNFLDNTLINHVSASSAHNLDAIDIDVIGSPPIDNTEELLNSTYAAGIISHGPITDDGDGTITVGSGSGLIRTWDNIYAPLVSFEWASSSSIAIGADALTYIYLDYNGGSPIIKTTTDRNDINYNSEICLDHAYRESGSLVIHMRVGGVHIEDFQRRVDRRIKDLRDFERSSGMVVTETGVRNIAITAGEGWRGLDKFTTSARNTSGSGDVFTYWYRDGGGGWTKVSGSTQINNTQYDDGSGALQTLSVNKYGVHWIFLCSDGHIDIVYGQGNYKLAEAQNAEVPILPDKIDNFDFIIARIIIEKNAATFTEVVTAFETFFPGSEVINHNDLGNIDGGQANEYYHLTDAEHGALVDGGSANGYHTHPDSGSLDTLDSVCDRGNTTDQDIIAADIKANGDIYINEDETDADAIIHFKTSGSVDETLRWDKTDNRFEFSDDLYLDEDLYINFAKKIHIPSFTVGPWLWEIWSLGDKMYLGKDSVAHLTLDGGNGDTTCIKHFKAGYGLTINKDADDANYTLEFNKPGVGSGSETLIWNKTNEWFEFSDDLYVNGNLSFDSLDSGSIEHNDLAGLQGGQANEYYHLTDAEHGALVDGGSANGYHTHPASGSGNGNGVKTLEFSVGGLALADGTAGSAAPALSLLTTSDAADPQCRTFCLRFDDTTDEHVFWQFRLPTDYSSGGRLIVQFYNVDTQDDDDNTAYFGAILQAVTPGDATDMTALDLPNDGGGWAGTSATMTAGSDGPRLYELSIDMTSNLDGMAAEDFIQFGLRRDISLDNGQGDIAVITIVFEYNY